MSARLTAAHFNIPGSDSVLLWQRLYNEGMRPVITYCGSVINLS